MIVVVNAESEPLRAVLKEMLMSATQDKSQKTTFVYSNLYQLYKKGQTAAKNAEIPAESVAKVDATPFVAPSSRNVIKSGDAKINAAKINVAKVTEYHPSSLIGKRVSRPESISSNAALSSLKDNLKNLNDLHARLRFMLQELEDLAKS